MMRSMTGFGRGEAGEGDLTCVVECSSVNRKQLEIVVQLPREIHSSELEGALRQQAQKCLSRGRVQIQVRLQDDRPDRAADSVSIDADVARSFATQLRELGRELELSGGLDLATLARLPGVAQLKAGGEETTVEPETVTQALSGALTELVSMREVEGANLSEDIATRLDALDSLLTEIASLAPEVTQRYREQLMQRLEEAGLPIPADDDRLIKEIALFADRSDISEELTRAQSHLQQFRDALNSDEPVGRRLDFLAQEFFREFNTTGAKANHSGIAHLVVSAKTELEKIREQIQNVE